MQTRCQSFCTGAVQNAHRNANSKMIWPRLVSKNSSPCAELFPVYERGTRGRPIPRCCKRLPSGQRVESRQIHRITSMRTIHETCNGTCNRICIRTRQLTFRLFSTKSAKASCVCSKWLKYQRVSATVAIVRATAKSKKVEKGALPTHRISNWPRRDSNPHVPTGQGILSPQRLPFRHVAGKFDKKQTS